MSYLTILTTVSFPICEWKLILISDPYEDKKRCSWYLARFWETVVETRLSLLLLSIFLCPLLFHSLLQIQSESFCVPVWWPIGSPSHVQTFLIMCSPSAGHVQPGGFVEITLHGMERESSLHGLLKNTHFQLCFMHICGQEDYGTCIDVCICHIKL